jgi:galactose mutarotase-like enzyme
VLAEDYLPVDATGIPRGGLTSVSETPFDLLRPTRIGDAVRTPHPQVVEARGIDHNFAILGEGWRLLADVELPSVRTRLELRGDQPGLQVYTGNFLDGTRRSTGGGLLRQGDGLALEPQLFPDSPNRPDFASPLLEVDEVYSAALQWRFVPLGD